VHLTPCAASKRGWTLKAHVPVRFGRWVYPTQHRDQLNDVVRLLLTASALASGEFTLRGGVMTDAIGYCRRGVAHGGTKKGKGQSLRPFSSPRSGQHAAYVSWTGAIFSPREPNTVRVSPTPGTNVHSSARLRGYIGGSQTPEPARVVDRHLVTGKCSAAEAGVRIAAGHLLRQRHVRRSMTAECGRHTSLPVTRALPRTPGVVFLASPVPMDGAVAQRSPLYSGAGCNRTSPRSIRRATSRETAVRRRW